MKIPSILTLSFISTLLALSSCTTEQNTIAEESAPLSQQEVTEDTSGVEMQTEVADDMSISFTDAIWDGITVPQGQWCSTFDGEGATPELFIENLPAGTAAISMAYSDRSFAANDNGGHGIIGMNI